MPDSDHPHNARTRNAGRNDASRSADAATAAPARWKDFARTATTAAATFAAGLAAGWLARVIAMPLPFILGPLFLVAAAGLCGLPVLAIRRIRPAGQCVTGAAVGVQFTHAVVLKLVGLLPLIVGLSLLSMFVCALAALMLMKLMDIDERSAFFATMPAGAAEMANIAARYGGAIEPITVAQTMRVALTVSAAPFLVSHLANDGSFHPVAQADVIPWLAIAVIAVCAVILGGALALIRFPNSWYLGALLSASLLGAFDLVGGRVPDVLLTIAQVIIGCSLGAQFRREFVTRLLHLMLASTAVVVFSGCTMALVAVGIAHMTGFPVPAMVLALAPAGMAEMTLTGKVLGLDAALIAGFHVLRIVTVLFLCVPAFRLFERIAAARASRG